MPHTLYCKLNKWVKLGVKEVGNAEGHVSRDTRRGEADEWEETQDPADLGPWVNNLPADTHCGHRTLLHHHLLLSLSVSWVTEGQIHHHSSYWRSYVYTFQKHRVQRQQTVIKSGIACLQDLKSRGMNRYIFPNPTSSIHQQSHLAYWSTCNHHKWVIVHCTGPAYYERKDNHISVNLQTYL